MDFIEFLNKQQKRNTEREASAYSENVVRIMSVHKSKGIEFPIVILCDVCTAKKIDNSPIVSSPELGICVKMKKFSSKKQTNYLVEKINLENDRREDAESLRLLYVALTRARDYLAIFIPNYYITEDTKKGNEVIYKAQDWYSLFLLFIGADFWQDLIKLIEEKRNFNDMFSNLEFVNKGFLSKIYSFGNFGKKFNIRVSAPFFEDFNKLDNKFKSIFPNLAPESEEKEIPPKRDIEDLHSDIKKTLQPTGAFGNILYLTPTKILSWFLCNRKFLGNIKNRKDL